MPLPQDMLNQNEDLVLDLHPHWWYFAESVGVLIPAVVAEIYISAKIDGGFWNFLPKVSGAVFAVAALWVGWKYMLWRTTHFAVTSYRVIYQKGFFSKQGIEIPLERVNNVNFNQTIVERVLGAGDLLIESGGQDGQQRFSDIQRPQIVKKMLLEQVQLRMDGRGGQRTNDVATQIEKLEGLLHRGAMTRDEFEREKRKILDS
ncbi:MAG: PH domain-containing protein [Actinomycetes bacterium]